MVFRFRNRQPEIQRRQQGENIGLDKGDQELKQVHENDEGY